ncbi:MAG TPA: class I SAM-dependent methyltransferase [Acidimicrobiales bacterium]|nr:class I SAM-dependent methyltransferase [Acidimicrobiales bacterium]
MDRHLPEVVTRAQATATTSSFFASCDPAVGRFLAALAAGLPPDARVLELGTGTGVGTAWLVAGLSGRSDVTVDTIELDENRSWAAEGLGWPKWVRFHQGDAIAIVPTLGTFQLVFADAEGGKWEGLDRTLNAAAPAGAVVVDDMAPRSWQSDWHKGKIEDVRETLLADPRFVSAELPFATGVILSVRLRASAAERSAG